MLSIRRAFLLGGVLTLMSFFQEIVQNTRIIRFFFPFGGGVLSFPHLLIRNNTRYMHQVLWMVVLSFSRVFKGQRSCESCHSFLLMSLSLGRGAGARPSAARHCGGAQSTAAPPSAPLLPRGRAGAQHDVVQHCCGELSCGTHVAQTARLA